ncbi:MAG: hypothetical protein M1365_07920, partial [Actinobacteria bacterium]|nr:hypothetical protein [Actinomycetota bacterium]
MLLTERYKDKIDGVLACYDRVVIHGNIPVLCFFTRILRRDLHEQGSGLVFILLLAIIKRRF